MTVIAEFLFGLGFDKVDTKNLEDAEKKAKAAAKSAEDAYKHAAKEVEKAQEAVRVASDKAAKKIAQDALHAARQQEKAAREASKVAIAELKKIEKANKEATRASDKALKDQNAMIGNIRGGLASLAAAAGIGGIAAITSSITEQATAVREWTARLGDAPDVIQRVGGAAKILGVDFEIAMKSIQKLRLGIGEGTADEPLKALGLDAKTLGSMDAQGQLRAIADGLQTVATDAERTAIATRLFGEEGGKLVPVLAGGAAGFDELTRAAEDAGAVMSTETLKAAQDFDRALNKATISAKGLAGEIAATVLPVLGDFSDDIGTVGEALGVLDGQADDTGESMDGVAGVVVAGLSLAWYPLISALGLVYAGFNEAADAAREYGLVSSRLTGRVGNSTGAIGAQARKLLAAQAKEQAEIDASVTTGPSLSALKDENRRQREKSKRKGGGAKKKTEVELGPEDFEAEELFGDELRRLAEQSGVGQVAIDAAIKSAGESLKRGDHQKVARQAALSRLGSAAGQDFKPSDDPLLSQIFGENVPDVELSKLAAGAQPQTLVVNISNHFETDVRNEFGAANDPAAVGDQVERSVRKAVTDLVVPATKLVKLRDLR